MRIVELDSDLIRKRMQVAVLRLMLADNGLHGCRSQEIELLQAQLFALLMVIFRIKHLGDNLRQLPLSSGMDIVAAVKIIQIEPSGRARAPKTQRRRQRGLIADYRHIIGHCINGMIVFMDDFQPLIGPDLLDLAVKAYFIALIGTRDFPYIPFFRPVVRNLNLFPVENPLPEQAIFIADTAANCRKLQCGKGIKETGGQAAQTAVSEARVGFLFLNVV